MADRQTIRQLKEQRAEAWEGMKSLHDDVSARDDGWSAEEDASWEAREADIGKLDKEIERAERVLEADVKDASVVEARVEETRTSAEQYNDVFAKYLRGGASSLEGSERSILAANESRAQSVGTTTAGGFTVPEGFWNRVVEAKLAFGGVEQLSTVITTADGQSLPWMTNNDTGNAGAILAENVQIGEQDVVFGTAQLEAFVYTSKLIRVSYQLLQDSALDIEGFLARKMGERLARIHNTHQTTGAGTTLPEGIAAGAATGKTTAGATAIIYNELVDLVHSVDPAYRASSTGFMLNDSTLAYIRKIRDDSGGAGLGRPVWEPSVELGAPSTILGYPYHVNQDMAAIATGNTTMLFGDFKEGYVVRNVAGGSLVRLDERYADYLQVGFFAYDRTDSIVQSTAAYKALVQL